MPSVETLTDIKDLLSSVLDGTLVRVTHRDATPGVGLHDLFDSYAILTVHETRECETIRDIHPVLTLEHILGKDIPRTHEAVAEDLFLKDEIWSALSALPGKSLSFLPYALRENTFDAFSQSPHRVLSLSPKERKKWNARDEFVTISSSSDIRTPFSRVIQSPTKDDLRSHFEEHGPCVLQDFHAMAGMGTTFIHNEKDIEDLDQTYLQSSFVVSLFAEGEDISCTGCVIGDHVLVSPVRFMLIGVDGLASSRAQYCGNDWNIDITEKGKKQMQDYARKIGETLKSKGYRGMYGIDAVWSRAKDEVTVIELNPRILGTSQLYAIQQMECNEPPLLGFHILSFLDKEISISPETSTSIAESVFTGSHVILRNLENREMKVCGEVEPGIYTVSNENISFSRPAVFFSDLTYPNEFLVTMVPQKGMHVGPDAQLLRIQRRGPSFDATTRILLPEIKTLVDSIRSMVQLEAV